MYQIKQRQQFLVFLLFPAIFATLLGLGLYGYLGIFSRYSADDYCLSAAYHQDTSLITSLVTFYTGTSSRYTNILFIGLADKMLGWYNPAILPALMLVIFVLGIYLFLNQIQYALGLKWGRWLIFYLSLFILYCSIVMIPNLFQTLYWRAGMTSHFAPVAFLPFLGAFVVKQIRLARQYVPSLWVYAVCFLIPFLIGGFSEPPTTLMITIFVLAIGAVWWWQKTPSRRSVLLILSWTLAGALTALIVLALAPANSMRLGGAESNVLILFRNIFYHTLEFVIDSVRTLPLPTLFSFAIPSLLFYIIYADSEENIRQINQKHLLFLIFIVILISYILIAASFAPSIYAQSYPAARARFAGVVLLTCTFIMIGAFVGILLAKSGITFLKRPVIQTGMLVVFTILSLYPLRNAWRISAEIPLYQQRAAHWDKRDAEIQTLKADGVQDLTIPFLSDDPVQDLGDHRRFVYNRCASRIYGVNSILALPMNDQ